MLVRIINREDPDQTASEEQSDLSLHCLSKHFCQATHVRNFRTFTAIIIKLSPHSSLLVPDNYEI